MAENTSGRENASQDQGQGSERDKNKEQTTQGQQKGANESRRGGGRSFNSPDVDDNTEQTRLNPGSQNASASRKERTDMAAQSLTGKGNTTKRNVTGSDFDGQVSNE